MARKTRAGFTLLELLIVIGIIALIASIVLVVVIRAAGEGDRATARNFINNVVPAAIQTWQRETGRGANDFPPSPNMRDTADYWEGNAELFDELVTKPRNAGRNPYIEGSFAEGEMQGRKVFMDPWGRHYIYRNHVQRRTRSGAGQEYKGLRISSTYDLISLGPEGVYDRETMIYRGD